MKSSNFKHMFLIAAVAMLTSCSESDVILEEVDNGGNVTFNLTADGLVQSRAAADDFRIVMAIYDETETNVVVAETEYTSSTFSVRIDPGKYVCLFWADRGSDNYDATNLNEVKLSDGATNAEAFYVKQGITVTDGTTVNVTLHRAVAQVVLRETATLLKGDLTIGYTGCHNFNVSTGIASNESAITHTISVPATITGSVESPVEVGSIFLLANSEENRLTDFSVKYEDNEAKTISNVPIQANRKTNLNGEFGVEIPYVTFSAASEQTFKFEFSGFLLDQGEYFEYAVGNSSWTRFTTTVSDIPFGGSLGDLRLRGKSHKGTSDGSPANILFGTAGITVDCTGDIRTLIDYENYKTTSTADARFDELFAYNSQLRTAPELPATTLSEYCYNGMFYNCTSLTKAPELPATTLAEGCYYGMFEYCSKLSEVTMLATINVGNADSLNNWLNKAGTEASSRTLTLANSQAYTDAESYLPDNWKQGATGTTVNFKN